MLFVMYVFGVDGCAVTTFEESVEVAAVVCDFLCWFFDVVLLVCVCYII